MCSVFSRHVPNVAVVTRHIVPAEVAPELRALSAFIFHFFFSSSSSTTFTVLTRHSSISTLPTYHIYYKNYSAGGRPRSRDKAKETVLHMLHTSMYVAHATYYYYCYYLLLIDWVGWVP